jgi:hypothetical protein
MYSKSEATQIKHAFWTAFGRYISAHLSSEGLRVNWINYNTGFRHLYFRMEADNKKASISIEMAHPDLLMQELFYSHFLELKTILHQYLGEEWEWGLHAQKEFGKTTSRIYKILQPVNVLNQQDWPAIISFFKPRIIALDEFWNDVKDRFDELR